MTADKAMESTVIKNTSIVETAAGLPPRTIQDERKQVIHHNSLFDAGFLTEKNIYFLVVVSIALIITGTITFIRRRQQKRQQHRKEQDYLRYFHSVLPHSQIYGNLNETFSKPNRKNSSKRASVKNRGLNRNEPRRLSVSNLSSAVTSNILKRFKYQHPSDRELTNEADADCQSMEDIEEDIGDDIDKSLDIEANISKQSVCKAEATVHSAFNKKVHFTETDNEDIHLNDINTAENICQKFYFSTEKRAGGIKDTAAKIRKYEPLSPRVRFSTESDEVMHDGIDIDKHIIDDLVTAADHESGKSNIAEGTKHGIEIETNSVKAQNGKVNHLNNGFINLMQKLSDRNTSTSNTNMQQIPDCDNKDISPETDKSASNQHREFTSENNMQSCDHAANDSLSDSIKKSVNFLHMQRCKRDKDMFCKKCEFLFDDKTHYDICNPKDVQITVL